MGKDRSSRRIQFWLGMGLSVACLVVIFWLVDPAEIAEALRSADYGYLLLSSLGILAFLALRAIRWRFMLRNQATWAQVFHIQNIGYLLTFLLPFRIGDVARAVLIGNVPPVTIPQGIATMVVERVLDLLFVVALLPIALTQMETVPPTIRTAAAVSAAFALAGIIILIVAANQRTRARGLAQRVLSAAPILSAERWMPRVDELLDGLSTLSGLRDGIYLGLLSIIVWLPVILAYYVAMLAVHLQATLPMAALVVCVGALSITAPSSPGHVGVFHAGVTFALVQILNQPEAPSVSFAFLYHGLNFVIVVILGLIGVYSIGATLSSVVASTRALIEKRTQAQAG
jgi:uncharacterized protein (TIRG00374 family)